MYGYAANSAAASTLAPFTPAPHTTNPATTAGQAIELAQAPLGELASLTSEGVSHTAGAGMRALSGLAAGTAKEASGDTAGLTSDVADLGSDAAGLGAEGGGIGMDLYGMSLDLQGADSMLGIGGAGVDGLGNLGGLTAVPALGTRVTAMMGRAAPLGALSARPVGSMPCLRACRCPPVTQPHRPDGARRGRRRCRISPCPTCRWVPWSNGSRPPRRVGWATDLGWFPAHRWPGDARAP